MNPDQAPEEPTSDPSVPVVKSDLRAAQNHVEAVMRRGLMWSDVKSAVIAAGAVGSVLLAGWGRVEAWAQSKVDAGTQPIARDVADLKAEVREMKTEHREALGRMERKFDSLFLYLRIPNPAPAPRDGGQ